MTAGTPFTATSTRDIVKRSAPFIRGDTLDLGAGTAKYKQEILRRASSYTSFDVADGPQIDTVGDIHATGYQDASFDTVICTQVLEHVRRPWEAVEEIRRILRPSGTCIFTAPFLLPFHADPHDYFRYTLEGGCSLFEDQGFIIVERYKYGGLPIVISEMWKFTFCNPYTHPRPGFVRRNAFRGVQSLMRAIGGKTDQRTSIYANVYIVARKPA